MFQQQPQSSSNINSNQTPGITTPPDPRYFQGEDGVSPKNGFVPPVGRVMRRPIPILDDPNYGVSSDQTIKEDEESQEAQLASLETRQIVEEILKLTRENNRILSQQRRAKKLESLRGVMKLVAILAFLVIAFMFIKPYLDGAKRIYSSVAEKVETVGQAAQTIQDTSETLKESEEKLNGFFSNLGNGFKSGLSDDLSDLDGLFGTPASGQN